MRQFFAFGCLVSLVAALAFTAWAQEAAPARPSSPAAAPKFKPRALAPGILTTISPQPEEAETFDGPREIPEITQGIPGLQWLPSYSPQSATLYEQAKKATFRRDWPSAIGTQANIWHLEFSFKPLRTITVDIPQPSGKLARKNILYLVYRVRNPGNHMNPQARVDEQGNTVYDLVRVPHPVRFVPHFVLESRPPSPPKSYLDRVIPLAVPAIQRREDPATPLYNSAQMPLVSIEPGESKWGVATWEDIDMRLDYFSIFVQGLTNARQVRDPEVFNPGDPPLSGRTYTAKTLQLNFWWPGDPATASEEFIRFGTPDDVEYRWLYR